MIYITSETTSFINLFGQYKGNYLTVNTINNDEELTRETKEKLSASLKKAYVEGRKTLTKEHLQKMQDARRYEFEPWNKGKTIDTGARVYQFTKDGEFIKEWKCSNIFWW